MTTVENIVPNVISNMAVSVLQTTAHWEILTPYNNSVVKDNLTYTDGCQLYALIAPRAAREDNLNLLAMK